MVWFVLCMVDDGYNYSMEGERRVFVFVALLSLSMQYFCSEKYNQYNTRTKYVFVFLFYEGSLG